VVTGRPLVVLGMVTAPPEPVYPVIVTAPLLVVKVNWACNAAGNASNAAHSRQAIFTVAEGSFHSRAYGKTDFDSNYLLANHNNRIRLFFGGQTVTAGIFPLPV